MFACNRLNNSQHMSSLRWWVLDRYLKHDTVHKHKKNPDPKSILLTYIYMYITAHFPELVQALQYSVAKLNYFRGPNHSLSAMILFQHRIRFTIQPQLQLVNLHRNRRYFVIKLHTWFCPSYFLKTNIKLYVNKMQLTKIN
jgi:hypothetical protein